jgi:mono/diheme cytochrome c family protein
MKVSRLLPLVILLLAGCDYMIDQPRQKTYAPQVAPEPPEQPKLTRALLERGQERFRIYCTPCHSELGDGHGMIVQRGFPPPPDYTIQRLMDAPVQHFYDVMTNGYGVMYSFANRVQPNDRWAIAAYIRTLQHARHATVADVPPDQQALLR